MVNQEIKPAGGKTGSVSLTEPPYQSELSDSPTTQSVAGRGRMTTAHPISFAAATSGLRKMADQSIPMDDQHESPDTSCPSEVFLG